MKINHLFYDSSVGFKKLTKRQVVLCIIIGLLFSFAIYSAFYVLREVFRIWAFNFKFSPNIFSYNRRWLSNLFFAYLSLIFGNSIAISFLFSSPQKVFSRRNNKRRKIINEQTFLNLNFMFWFSQIVLTLDIMTLLDFQFFPEYYIPFALLLFVMYLETWKTLLRVIKRKKHLYMLFHFLFLSCLAFGFSKIDIVNYNKLDENILSKNPILDLPKSFYHDNKYIYRNPFVRFKLTTDENNNLVVFHKDYNKISLKDIQGIIYAERERLPEELVNRMLVLILANKSLKIKHLKAFEAEIYATGIRKVRYNILNEDIESHRFKTLGFNKILSKSVLKHKVDFGISLPSPFPGPPPPPEYLDTKVFSDTIKITINREIKLNNTGIKDSDLVNVFEEDIDRNTLFLYELSTETSHQNYITVLSAHIKAIHNLRQKNTSFNILKERYDFSEYEKEELNNVINCFPTIYKENYQQDINQTHHPKTVQHSLD